MLGINRIKVILQTMNEIIDVSEDCLKNWDEVEISLSRSDYTGVIRSVSTKFEFVSKAKDLLFSDYKTYYLSSKAYITIYRLTENWSYSNLVFYGELDFSTVEFDGIIFSINAKENSFSDLVKAKKSTNFDILYSEVEDKKKLHYDRINYRNTPQWTSQGGSEEEPYKIEISHKWGKIPAGTSSDTFWYAIPLAYLDTDMRKPPFECLDQTGAAFSTNDENVIPQDTDGFNLIRCLRNAYFTLNTNFKIKPTQFDGLQPAGNTPPTMGVMLGRVYYDYDTNTMKEIILAYKEIARLPYVDPGLDQPGMNEEQEINLSASISCFSEEKYGVYIRLNGYSYEGIPPSFTAELNVNSDVVGNFDKGALILADTMTRVYPNVDISCFTPQKLLEALVNKIKLPEMNITCIIDTTDIQCVLVAGESIRRFTEPKIHTSFNDFADFMECCFGFTYTIIYSSGNDYTIRFGKREDLYVNEVSKEINDYSEFEFAQDTSIIYSSVKIGYSKYDYEKDNGNNEYNFTNEYTTGVSLTDSKLEMTSKYRADSYGFEYAVQDAEDEGKVDEDSKDEDKDIFVIHVNEDDKQYTINRSIRVYSNIRQDYIEDGSCQWLKELYVFGNYYIPFYLISVRTIEDGKFVKKEITIGNVFITDTGDWTPQLNISNELVFKITIPPAANVQTYVKASNTNFKGLMLIDWSNGVPDYEIGSNYELTKAISCAIFERYSFNVMLNPQYCVKRNGFMITPCTMNLEFASSDGNSDVVFHEYNENPDKFGIFKMNDNIEFPERRITVNTLTFQTSETELPTNKDALVQVNTNYGTYKGYLLDAVQNIGNNEAAEYKLILTE